MAPPKQSKKSKAQRLDERAYSIHIPKAKQKISNIYNGDQMILRSKTKLLARHSIGGCYVTIKRNFPAEALRWLERGGQLVRLPPLPQFPNERNEPNVENPPHPNGQNEEQALMIADKNDENAENDIQLAVADPLQPLQHERPELLVADMNALQPLQFNEVNLANTLNQNALVIAVENDENAENDIRLAVADPLQPLQHGQSELLVADMNALQPLQSNEVNLANTLNRNGQNAQNEEHTLMIAEENYLQLVLADPLLRLQQEQPATGDMNAFQSCQPNPTSQNEVQFNERAPSEAKQEPELVIVDENDIQLVVADPEQIDQVDLDVLASQYQPMRLMPKRRFSTAGGMLFSVNEIPRETGSDFLIKKPVDSNIIAQPANVQNNFDPFVRIDNPPFTLTGRKRCASQDGYFNRFKPLLEAIKE